MPTSFEIHDQLVAAAAEQRRTLRNAREGYSQWDRAATRFRADPRRPWSDDLTTIASYVQPGDVFMDVGGGAGRYALPIATRCREAICVDPSPGMGREFAASAAEASITNARFVEAPWQDAPDDVIGDVTLVAHVTYFVPHIRPFIEKLIAQTRRRVILAIGSIPPPNMGADLFELVEGIPLAPVPTQRELLPVLWDIGILPEVRFAGGDVSTRFGSRPYATREEAIDQSVRTAAGENQDLAGRTRRIIEERFDDLFAPDPSGGFTRKGVNARLLLITWEV
jgi:SAM-dependent methyltransferase